MKSLFVIAALMFISGACKAQVRADQTAELEKKIKQEIDIEIPKIEQQLRKTNTNLAIIEFTLDTLRIEMLMDKRLKSAYSDFGMRDIAYGTAKLYDSLLNKYYKKLLARLQPEDKKVLVKAQKNWIAFRDSESDLISTISKDQYSGGGTMQQLTEASEYLEMVKTRTVAIFNHLARATQID